MSGTETITWAADTAPDGFCYRLLLWDTETLPEAQLHEWKEAIAGVMARMRDAGIRGARGTLAALENEMRELNCRLVESPLATQVRGAFTHTRANAVATRLSGMPGVFAFRLAACTAELVIQPDADHTPESFAAAVCEAGEGVFRTELSIREILTPQKTAELLAACRAEDTGCALFTTELTDETTAASFRHVTVLAHEATEALLPAEGRVLVDATLGGGGHSELLLQAGAEVWGIDRDPMARAAAAKRLAPYGERLHIIGGNFRNAVELLHRNGVDSVDGILADIGISSPQVDCAERGFSFLHEGPLDMRMDPATPRSAADIVNTASEAEIADILWQYGEERASRAIARRIVQKRAEAPITTTTQLADIIASVLPRKGKQHPATRSFQALRIAVNDELGALDELLAVSLDLLRSGGRLAVITFHSLEDRAVKHFFERVTRPEIDRPEWPAPRPNPEYRARLVFRKPITAGEKELAANPRSRSAKLRVIEKL